MDDEKRYEIGGKQCRLGFLTIRQAKALQKLIRGIDFENIKSTTIIDTLIEHDILNKALSIVLVSDDPVDYDDMTIVQLTQVVEDFLALNDVSGIIGKIFNGISAVSENIDLSTLAALGTSDDSGNNSGGTSSQPPPAEIVPNLPTSNDMST